MQISRIFAIPSEIAEGVWLRFWRPTSVARWLVVLNLMVSLSMAGLAAWLLWQMRNDAWRQAQQASMNLLQLLSRDIARNVELYDASLQGTLAVLKNPALAGIDPELRHLALFDRGANAAYLGVMLVVDAAGNVTEASQREGRTSINLADREHFRVHQDRPDAGLFISHAFPGRLLHEDVIAMTRRVDGPDGRFGGIVEGVIKTAYFSDIFQKLDLPPGGSVTLVRDDGHVIMRRPWRAQDINADLSKAAVFQPVYRAKQGTTVGVSPLDGVTRVFTFMHIENLPLIVISGTPVAGVYAEWRQQALGIGAILLVLITASVLLSSLVQRELLRRLRAEASLVAAAKRLGAAAATDGLTGIANRRSFEEALAREWRRAIRAETALAVLMVDVDCFKLFNDQYGHQLGDEVLRQVAQSLARSVRRPADLMARYGGEEFVVLLPETDLSGAVAVGETVRASLAVLGIPHEGSPTGRVTASIGVAVTHPRRGEASSTLIRRADEALYRAKREGRNRVIADAASESQVTLTQQALARHFI